MSSANPALPSSLNALSLMNSSVLLPRAMQSNKRAGDHEDNVEKKRTKVVGKEFDEPVKPEMDHDSPPSVECKVEGDAEETLPRVESSTTPGAPVQEENQGAPEDSARKKDATVSSEVAKLLGDKDGGKSAEFDGDDPDRVVFTFPERLMELLNEGVARDSMWWLEDGNGFCVVPKLFAENVLNKYFQGTKFESFTRKLNRWGFKRAAGQHIPQHTIAYYHTHFQRGKPELLKTMSGGKKKDSAAHEKTIGKQPKFDMQAASAFSAAGLGFSPGMNFSQMQLNAATAQARQLNMMNLARLGLPAGRAQNQLVSPGAGSFMSPAMNMLGPQSHQQPQQAISIDQEIRLQSLLAEQQRADLIRQQQQANLFAPVGEQQQQGISAELRRLLVGHFPPGSMEAFNPLDALSGAGGTNSASSGDLINSSRILLSSPGASMPASELQGSVPDSQLPQQQQQQQLDQNLLQILLAQRRQQQDF